MNFRLIALASCVALGSIALSGKAQAQSVDVNFSGTVTNTCTYGTVTAGVLKPVTGFQAVSSTATGGSSGAVTVTCTGPVATLAVATPVLVGTAVTAFTPTAFQSAVKLGTTTRTAITGTGTVLTGPWAVANAASLPLAAGANALTVDMLVGKNTAGTLPGGSYTYKVVLTATPN
jgi:hypothetical protein